MKEVRSINYYFWILPVVGICILVSFVFGSHMKQIVSLSNPKWKIIGWFGILFLIFISLITRNICLALFLYDSIFFLFYLFFLKRFLKTKQRQKFCMVFLFFLAFAITIYGVYNADHIQLKSYRIESKRLKNKVTIGLLSDFHLGTISQEAYFQKIWNTLDQMQVDYLVLAGDIFDEFTTPLLQEKMFQKLEQLPVKKQIYYVEGNHDLMTSTRKKRLEKSPIKVLLDDVDMQENICFIGRCDRRRERLNQTRKTLESLVKKCPSDFPIIVLNHEPEEEEQGQKLGVLLQLSGHTHNGQFFPGNFFLKYGHYEKKQYHLIVSSGVGAWYLPVKTVGQSEIVKIELFPSKNEF